MRSGRAVFMSLRCDDSSSLPEGAVVPEWERLRGVKVLRVPVYSRAICDEMGTGAEGPRSS